MGWSQFGLGHTSRVMSDALVASWQPRHSADSASIACACGHFADMKIKKARNIVIITRIINKPHEIFQHNIELGIKYSCYFKPVKLIFNPPLSWGAGSLTGSILIPFLFLLMNGENDWALNNKPGF